MFKYKYIRCFHHKPPYNTSNNVCCCDAQKKDDPSYNEKTTMKKADNHKENPQGSPAARHTVTAPKTTDIYKKSAREMDTAINIAATVNLPDPPDDREVAEEDVIITVQNIAESDSDNTSTATPDDDGHTGKDDKSGDLPLTAEAAPLSECSECDIHTIFSSEAPIENLIMDAADRIADAVSKIIEAAQSKGSDNPELSGLLHFREWWELVEVNICVGGKLISGIPIFMEEDTLRVVDRNHSYFIPLRKVDYIRTNDGLCSDVSSTVKH